MSTTAVERAGKFLTLCLGREEYGIRVENVREIIGNQDAAAVPYTPEYIRGVINLRGKIIPVIDLRAKFGLPVVEYTDRSCIIVIQADTTFGPITAGVLVDSVSEVVQFRDQDIDDNPDYGMGAANPVVLGIAKGRERVKILIDIAKVIESDQAQLASLATPE